jgi:tripartite-type tricarboxylate transporter receptor subunit TctC
MRKRVFAAALVLAAVACAAPGAAQSWPSRPIQMAVGFGAGGGTDILARILAAALSESLGQPVVVENKPGAGGTIAAEAVAKAAPDGHTIFMMNNGHAVSAVLYKKLPFDPVADFAPVAMVATMPLVFVASRGLGVKNLRDLVELAKRQPGRINFASVGIGSTQHFAAELLRQMTGVEIVHVPYRGTPAAIAAVRGGEVQLLAEVAAPVIGQIEAGELNALAVTSKARFEKLPQTPTMAEAGFPDYDVTTWYALTYPARTPAPVVARMGDAVRAALARPALREQIERAAFLPSDGGSPEALGAHLRGEIAKWRGVREKAGIEQQ